MLLPFAFTVKNAEYMMLSTISITEIYHRVGFRGTPVVARMFVYTARTFKKNFYKNVLEQKRKTFLKMNKKVGMLLQDIYKRSRDK